VVGSGGGGARVCVCGKDEREEMVGMRRREGGLLVEGRSNGMMEV
jgi:hypothetical protein